MYSMKIMIAMIDQYNSTSRYSMKATTRQKWLIAASRQTRRCMALIKQTRALQTQEANSVDQPRD